MRMSLQSLIAADASREQIEDWCRQQTQSYPVPLASAWKVRHVLRRWR